MKNIIMNPKKDPRIKEYLYWDQLLIHLKHDPKNIFNDEIVYPKQFEIHLPSNHIRHCCLNCEYCAGKNFEKPLGNWELTGLSLLDKISGRIPQHIYGGSYTEPLMNPYLMSYLAKTKQYGNSFGIHTNGVMLKKLDESVGFLTELNRIAEGDSKSYLQISLDGATPWGWNKVKKPNTILKNEGTFWDIIDSVKKAVDIRKNKGSGHAIRLGYLISEHTASPEEFGIIVNLAKNIGVDSVRFSIPFAAYNQNFDEVEKYKENVEIPGDKKYEEWLKPYISKSKNEKPYIFWNYPWFTDISRFDFPQCVYTYFQITLAADGWFYPCSTVSTPTAKHLRIDHCTDDIDKFENILMKIQDPKFKPENKCFKHGLRCNRMGLEVNTEYYKLIKEGKVEDRRDD